jgi:type I restriction enzyme, S subunit
MSNESIARNVGWTIVAFGDVVALSGERSREPASDGLERFVGLEHVEPGDLRIRDWGNIVDGTTFTNVFRPGQVLFAKRRAYQRKVAVASFSGVCSGDIYVLEPKNEHLLPELLPFICQTDEFFAHAVGTSAGSLSPRTNWSSLATFEFALPPTEEQRQAAIALQSAQRVLESLLEVVDRARLTQAAAFSEIISRNRAVPCKLGDVLLESPRNGCSAPPASVETGHWVLALSAISRWGYRRGELKPVARTPAMGSAVITKGDLVLSRSNTRELVGLPAIFPEDRTDVSYPDTMMRLVTNPVRMDSHYLELCLRTADCRRQVQSFAAGTSASMKKINATNLQKVVVPLIPVGRQVAVLQEVAHISRFIDKAEARAAEARLLSTALSRRVLGFTL